MRLIVAKDYADVSRKAYRQLSPKEREQRGKVALKMARCYERINQSQRANSAYANALRYGQAGFGGGQYLPPNFRIHRIVSIIIKTAVV